MTQGKLIALWIAAMLGLGGFYVYTTARSNAERCDCASCKQTRENPGASVNLAPALELNLPMPPVMGHWVTPDEKAPTFKGNVVLLDFWGTFCAPCIAAIPSNNRVFEKFGPKGLVMAGISTDSKIALGEFKKSVDVRYPLLASNADTLRAYKIEFTPSLFMFDRSGKLVWKGVRLENQDGSLNSAFEKALLNALESSTTEATNISANSSKETAPSDVSLPPEFQKLIEQANANKAKAAQTGEVADEPGLKMGAPIPELKGDWLTSAPDLKDKVLLIDFFTTVCGSCVASIPDNNALYARYAPQGFIFAFVSSEPKATVDEFTANFPKKISYPVLTNANALFDFCDVKTLPTTLLFGRNGKLLWKGGALEKDGKLDANFEKVLNEALNAK